MYSLRDYGGMIGDDVRILAYAAALEEAVEPGMTVLDLGAGTGIFAMMACRFGAARVHAIETSEAAVITGRELAERNRIADRIEWHAGSSREVELVDRADLMVADLRGTLPFLGDSVETVIDARERLLMPGAKLIPARDRCVLALAESPRLEREATRPWGDNDFGFDWEPMRHRLVNQWARVRIEPGERISEPRPWCAIDYSTVTASRADGEVTLLANRAGTVHGFFLWFDAELTGTIGYSSGPDEPSARIYRVAFFPFPEGKTIKSGEAVSIRLSALPLGDQKIWRWSTKIAGESFEQSTFSGVPLSRESLGKARDGGQDST